MTAIQLTSLDYYNQGLELTAKELGGNKFALPAITKVIVNVGIGKFKNEKSQQDEILDLIEKLTGQVPKKVYSKEAISGFKLRAGELVGVTVTLRGAKMKDFLLNLVYLSLPRTKDFKGIKTTAWDNNFSSYSLGIPDSAIFPQIGFNGKFTFGLQVVVSFKNGSEKNKVLLNNLKFPFQKTK
jgi:large subunit ribosomal protein L5